MAREYPSVPFERYADDAVVHCNTKAQAEEVLAALSERMAQVGLELHPDKTRIVYCKDSHRHGSHEHQRFDFLGHADLRVMPTSAEVSLWWAAIRLMGSA